MIRRAMIRTSTKFAMTKNSNDKKKFAKTAMIRASTKFARTRVRNLIIFF